MKRKIDYTISLTSKTITIPLSKIEYNEFLLDKQRLKCFNRTIYLITFVINAQRYNKQIITRNDTVKNESSNNGVKRRSNGVPVNK